MLSKSDFHQLANANDIKNIILWTVVCHRPTARLGPEGFSLAVRWRLLVNHHADGKNIFKRSDLFPFERCIACNFAIFLSEDGPLWVAPWYMNTVAQLPHTVCPPPLLPPYCLPALGTVLALYVDSFLYKDGQPNWQCWFINFLLIYVTLFCANAAYFWKPSRFSFEYH